MRDADTDPTSRSFRLLTMLQSRSEWPADEVADRLGVGARTLRRDITRLRGLGYAIDSRPGPHSVYRLVAGVAIPPLLFTEDEATVLAAGLAVLGRRVAGEAVDTAFAKLTQVLPRALRRRLTATELATEVLDSAGDGVDAGAVGTIADAVASDGRIRFTYVDARGATSIRLVDPYRHALRGSTWYLIGYDVDRRDWRTFRFDRVTDLVRVPGTYRRPDFPDASIAQWLSTDFGRVRPSGTEAGNARPESPDPSRVPRRTRSVGR